MSCAACSASVEKAVLKVKGVTSCSVSLLTNSMTVEGTANIGDIISAVEKAGYGAKLKNSKNVGQSKSDDNIFKNKEIPILRNRLAASLIFLVILMYFSMGHTMWNWKVPKYFENNHIAIGLLQLILTAIIMVINQKFFISGFKGFIHRAPNMDTLVALGSMASFLYSTCVLFAMTSAQISNDHNKVMMYMHEFYFESAGMILTLITLGKLLEAYSKGKTTDALKNLMKLAPKTATIIVNDKETEVPVEEIKRGDIFVVRPGENIAVDGIIIEGNSAVDESALTGESIPIDKAIGDKVSSATINQSGFIKCEATRVGEDTTLSKIIKMVSDASATKAPIAKIADKVSGVFVPMVICISIAAMLIWLLTGSGFGFALARGISVLVISCPCALGLATPVAIMVGNGVGAKNGILFKTAASLEETGKIQIVALDKTGTITNGQPKVTDIIPINNVSEMELMRLAYSLEIKSEHPLAKAIIGKAEEMDIKPFAVSDFKALSGNGLSAVQNNDKIIGGSFKFISDNVTISNEIKEKVESLSEKGKTPLLFSRDNKLIGIIAVADTIKEDSPEAIKELKNMGIKIVMLTGDNEKTANAIGNQAQVDEVIAGVLPEGKESVIRSLQKKGKVAMVGDGMNDAPALTRADIGIAIGAGTDIAIDSADIVLMKSTLKDVPKAVRLSRATLKNIHQNLFWAFFYNTIGIPIAAGLFIPILGWQLNPMFAAAAMSLSSFCVVTNALRLNLVNINKSYRNKKIKTKNINNKLKEYDTMKRTIKIEGMMCGHCEARVKKSLEALPQVNEAIVSHTDGTAIVSLNKDVANDILKDAVEAQDYKVLSID